MEFVRVTALVIVTARYISVKAEQVKYVQVFLYSHLDIIDRLVLLLSRFLKSTDKLEKHFALIKLTLLLIAIKRYALVS